MLDKSVANNLIAAFYSEKRKGLRMGQYLMNKLADEGYTGLVDPEIFYEEDATKAREAFLSKYVYASEEHVAEWEEFCKDIPKLHISEVKKKVRSVEYVVSGRAVICILEAANGARMEGSSHTVHSQRFNLELAKRLAYGRAFDKLVEREAYVLRTELTKIGQ